MLLAAVLALAFATGDAEGAVVIEELGFWTMPGDPVAEVTPRVRRQDLPAYTLGAWMRRMSGVVIVHAAIDVEGRVTDVRVLKGLPLGMTERVTEAVRKWELEPVVIAGEAVPATLDVTFRIEYPGDLGSRSDPTELAAWLDDVTRMAARDPTLCLRSILGGALRVGGGPGVESLLAAVDTGEDSLVAWAARLRQTGRPRGREWEEVAFPIWEAMLESRLACVRCWGAENLWREARGRRELALRAGRVADLEARYREMSPGSTDHIVGLATDGRFLVGELSDRTRHELRRERARRRDEPPMVYCPTGVPRRRVFFERETRAPICVLAEPSF